MAGEKSGYWSNGLLALLFNATTLATIAQNVSSSPLTNLYVALHTADPTASGNQSTNEVAYTSYARVAVARTSGGWTVSTNTVEPVAAISFPACTGGSTTATYFSIGVAASGATQFLYAGPITPSLAISTGVTPQLTTATMASES
jgi:hypothetical protein